MVTTRVNVRFYETDMMGIVHHSNHIRWFEMGRCEYLNAAGVTIKELLDRGYVFPIMNVQCDYISAINYGDTIIIETIMESVSRAQMTFKYRLVRASDNTLMATGSSKGAIASKETGRIVRIDQDLYERIMAFVDKDRNNDTKCD